MPIDTRLVAASESNPRMPSQATSTRTERKARCTAESLSSERCHVLAPPRRPAPGPWQRWRHTPGYGGGGMRRLVSVQGGIRERG